MFAKKNFDQAVRRAQQPQNSEAVKVIVRCRPFLPNEVKKQEKNCIFVENETNQVSILRERHSREYKTFRYDGVFDEHCSQQDVYGLAAFAVVEKSFAGYNGTVFAYGQTGCGKTYTMVGGS